MNFSNQKNGTVKTTVKTPPRVLMGGIHHETHTFLPGVTTRRDFAWVEGESILDARGDSSPQAGAISVADECGWQLIPMLDARGGAGPVVSDEIVETWWKWWQSELQARRGGFDAVFLALHGAMVSQSLLDVEGEMLRRIRELVGPEVLIAGVTDLHGNFSSAMAQNADVLVTYRENPHSDGFESGARAARLLHRIWQSGKRPRTRLVHPPLLWTPSGTATASDPMRELEEIARAAEENPDIWAVNVHGGFCFADTPHTGVSFSVVSVGEEAEVRQVLDELCECAWRHRVAGARREPALEEALPQIAAHLKARSQNDKRPVVVAEPSDNIGGGAPGDGTHLLRALLETNFATLFSHAPMAPDANGNGANGNGANGNGANGNGANGTDGVASGDLGDSLELQPPLIGATLWDPLAVQGAQKLAPHEKTRLAIGGHSSPLAGAPLELEVECIARSDGRFRLEDPHSHLAARGACDIEMGESVLLRVVPQNGVRNAALILVTTLPTCPFDLGQWRCLGAHPEAFDLIIVKAAVGHRQAYAPIEFASLSVGTPGPCAGDLRTLPYRHAARPSFPLDEFEPAEWSKTRQTELVAERVAV